MADWADFMDSDLPPGSSLNLMQSLPNL